jgi:hypothetical protein
MATYVQGVNNVIPQIQPFQPDLNFYANALGTKQNQYDSNYKALSNAYGQFYYADLTRDSSIEKKDHLIKDIDFNMKRIAGLDLSLEQNVNQASQIFKPFYEDKALMKDMAWTKNYSNSRGRAEGLKLSEDEKMRSQYWENGVKALDYQREEFKETTDDESLNFGNVSYTPYVNTMKEAMKLAKEAGLSVETVDFSPDGKWIIKQKNGEALMSPLNKLFESTLGNDPAVQAVYKTQAYVNRKDYAYANAAQFGGDKNQAELDYLEKNFKMLKEMSTQRLNETRDASKSTSGKVRDVEKQIEDGNALPEAGNYLDRLKQAQQVNDSLLNQAEGTEETLSNGSKTSQTSTGFDNPYGDIKSLRYKVDSAMASLLMQKDLGEAAYVFSHQNMSTDIDANPYKVLEIKQANTMRAIKAKEDADARNIAKKHGLATGLYSMEADGSIVPNRIAFEGYSVFTDDASTGPEDMFALGERVVEDSFQDAAKPFTENLMLLVDDAIKMENGGYETVKELFKGTINLSSKEKYQAFKKKYKERGFDYIQELARRHNDIDHDVNFYDNLAKNTKSWMTENSHLSVVDAHAAKIDPYLEDLKDFGANLNSYNKWKSGIASNIIKDDPALKLFFDKNNNLLDEETVLSKMQNASPEMKKLFTESPSYSKSINDMRVTSPFSANVAGAILDNFNMYEQGKKMIKNYVTGVHEKVIAKMSDPKYVTSPPPFIQKGGNALSSTRSGYKVLPQAWPSAGVQHFQEFARGFSGTDLDGINNLITFNGASKDAFNKSVASTNDDDFSQTEMGKMIIQDLITQMSHPKNKLAPFSIEAQAIAAGDANKSAYIIKPTREFLEKYKAGKDDNINLSTEAINSIASNGLTIISKHDNQIFQSSLFNSFLDPIAAQVESNNKYEWSDPTGTAKMLVTKDNYGEYNLKQFFKVWDVNTKKYEEVWSSDIVGPNHDYVSVRKKLQNIASNDLIPQNKAAANGR